MVDRAHSNLTAVNSSEQPTPRSDECPEQNSSKVVGDRELNAHPTFAHHDNDGAAPSSDATDDLRPENGWRFVVVGGSLIPPSNFGMIEDDMYRSGMANELNFAFLERLHLKTMLYLASEELSDALLDFVEDQGIEIVQLAPEQDEMPAPWKPMSEDVVLSAMDYLLNPDTYPIYVMCSQGRHRTGTVIGCLRKLQRWSLSSIFEEYHRYADGRGRLANEQFIELFDIDLINLPTTNRPRWLR